MKKALKLKVNNKLKGALGATTFKKGTTLKTRAIATKVEINIKKHKGDKKELASTVKHELMHVKHPRMTEKEVYKRTAKTKISPMEQITLLKKIGFKPGELISKAREINKSLSEKKRLSIKGLV